MLCSSVLLFLSVKRVINILLQQEAMRESANDNTRSPEVTSQATKADDDDDEVKESVKSLTEKLSAALVNVSAKEDLVKQHAKVAEEAVAGNDSSIVQTK